MNIAIITTINHNVGDDFVREGIKYLLEQYFKNKTIKFQNIHKHSPITTRYGFEWFRYLRLSSKVDKLIPKWYSRDRILEADIVVQSGAPLYWCHDTGGGHCCNTSWYEPLIKERFLKNNGAKLLNIAAGTCQRYYSDGSEFCDRCSDFMKEFYNLADVTTLRDKLAKNIFSNMGIDAPLIPCSSIFAIDRYGLKSEGEDYVVLNYMKGGSHFVFGQDIDVLKWEQTFKEFYLKLKTKQRVILSCHNKKELKDALLLDPNAEIFYEKDDYLSYMKFYSKAKFGIVNRVHAAYMMASYGKASIVIGNDSRATMLDEIGLKHYFVNEVDVELLDREYQYLKDGADDFKQKFKSIKQNAFKDYMKAFDSL
jgi:hypothetical protein